MSQISEGSIRKILEVDLSQQFNDLCQNRKRIRRELLQSFWKLEKKSIIISIVLSLILFNKTSSGILYGFLAFSLVGLYPILLVLIFPIQKNENEHSKLFVKHILDPIVKIYYPYLDTNDANKNQKITITDLEVSCLFEPPILSSSFHCRGDVSGTFNGLSFRCSGINCPVFNGIFGSIDCDFLKDENTQVFPNIYRWRRVNTEIARPGFIRGLSADYPNTKLNDKRFMDEFVMHTFTHERLDVIFTEGIKGALIELKNKFHFYTSFSFSGTRIYFAIPRDSSYSLFQIPSALSLDSSSKSVVRSLKQSLNEIDMIHQIMSIWHEAIH